ncbi:MarR family transcriptional regulator [Variovorax dokdonensis]|uniref:MarR family transcriptional regulator n=1 Tax=Variovorax dokdonensis TaxID=344883 RepID=A0ABT7NBZ6_9BURK|nr:MarR family transcriptional regulator [Variovorax dokdonensis]MDM0045441.1 MarR family transcriptional regulator [Variovorax dokdonensis]
MKKDFSQRLGFLVNDVARMFGAQFDRLARERIGLSRAQCRVLGELARDEEPLSQADLAQRMELTPMAIGGLCERLEAGGWIERRPSAADRRAYEVHLAPNATKALEDAMAISDDIQAVALADLNAAEKTQLMALLGRVRRTLLESPGNVATKRQDR